MKKMLKNKGRVRCVFSGSSKSKVNRGKSIDVLISSWVDVPEEFKYLRDKAVVLFDKVSEGEKKVYSLVYAYISFSFI